MFYTSNLSQNGIEYQITISENKLHSMSSLLFFLVSWVARIKRSWLANIEFVSSTRIGGVDPRNGGGHHHVLRGGLHDHLPAGLRTFSHRHSRKGRASPESRWRHRRPARIKGGLFSKFFGS